MATIVIQPYGWANNYQLNNVLASGILEVNTFSGNLGKVDVFTSQSF